MTVQTLSMSAYLISAIFFILALKGLSSPTSARQGNLFGMIGMGYCCRSHFVGGAAINNFIYSCPIVTWCVYWYICSQKSSNDKDARISSIDAFFCGFGSSINCYSGSIKFREKLTLQFKGLNYLSELLLAQLPLLHL